VQPELQKLPWRNRAPSYDRDFSQEDQKDGSETWGFALPPAICCALRAERRGQQSNLLSF
jgi:hypothetical protein